MLKSKRLQIVYSFLDKDLSTADIGCDHGLLIIEYANLTNKDCFGIDNKNEPLSVAIKNKEEFLNYDYKLDNLSFILSDGLNDLSTRVEQIAIAGVGGNNIINMLDDNLVKARNIQNFVFQANSDLTLLRDYLSKNNFKIIDESLVEENEIIYVVIKVINGKQILNYKQKVFGPILLKKKDELFNKYYLDIKNRCEHFLEIIPKKEHKKRKQFIKLYKLINKEI